MRALSWLTVIPLASVAFIHQTHIDKLKKSGVIGLLCIIGGLAIANIFRIGKLSYEIGLIYIGTFLDEAPLAIALAMFLPFLFLPEKI